MLLKKKKGLLASVPYGIAGLPGPPTLTFQSQVAGTTSTSTSSATISTGTASATRRVIVFVNSFGESSATTLSSATFDGNAALSSGTIINNSGAGLYYAIGDVPTGTTSALVLTFSRSISGNYRIASYTIDNSQMASATPTPFSSSALSSAVIDTLSLTVPNNGSVLIAGDTGGNNVTKTFGGSPVMTSDANFNVTKVGHANSIPAGSPSLTINWTPASVVELFGALLFR